MTTTPIQLPSFTTLETLIKRITDPEDYLQLYQLTTKQRRDFANEFAVRAQRNDPNDPFTFRRAYAQFMQLSVIPDGFDIRRNSPARSPSTLGERLLYNRGGNL